MEFKITTQHVLNLLLIISWIIFVGLCIEAGGVLVNGIVTLVLNPEGAKNLWKLVDLKDLYEFDRGHYIAQLTLIGIVVVMKPILFYQIIAILQDKKLNMAQPFNAETGRFIFNLSYLALAIGMFSLQGARYAKWLAKKGVTMPDNESLLVSGGDVWLFMGVTIYVIGLIFKRGIEIQTENELTV